MFALLPRWSHVREFNAAADAIETQAFLDLGQRPESALPPDGTAPTRGERGRPTTSPGPPDSPVIGEHGRGVRLAARRQTVPCARVRRSV